MITTQRPPDTGELTIGPAPSGSGFRLEASLLLPAPRERVFAFFSDAFQLETLTPPWLRFSVLTPPPIALATGALIDYRLRIHGIPWRWQSRISVWEPPYRFVDEQLHGPYRRWYHEHTFEALGDHTLCRDVVDYAVPGGRLMHTLLVRRDLETIFSYRMHKLLELFPSPAAAARATNPPLHEARQ